MPKERLDNLFSEIEKYHIKIMYSYYRLCLVYSLFVAAFIFAFITFSQYLNARPYLIILAILALSILFVGVLNSTNQQKKKVNIAPYSFTLTAKGVLTFLNDDVSYQLCGKSRFSFLGCWLILAPLTVKNIALQNKRKKSYFIYRDSLSGQDFARIITVINSLA